MTATSSVDYRYPHDHQPASDYQRYHQNIAALELLATLNETGEPATVADLDTLAAWSGWGACAADLASNADRVRSLIGEDGYQQARSSTINAHYTPIWLANQMWELADRLGYADGPILEPGCGHGVFLGTSPHIERMVGIEKDATTATIAATMYPSARIVNSPIEDYPIGSGSYAAVIGNVPFADIKPYDRVHNPGRKLSLHNYCIVRSLEAAAPGAVVALLTSRYTMDSVSSYARERMAAHAELVGAVRFPSGAFSKMAGTDAIIDLLVFVKRATNTAVIDDTWLAVTPQTLPGGIVRQKWGHSKIVPTAKATINSYWAEHPERVLGVAGIGRGMYRDDEYLLHGHADDDLPTMFAAAVADMRRPHHETVEMGGVCDGQIGFFDADAINRLPGTILAAGDRFVVVVNPADGETVDHDPGKFGDELGSLCQLRDAAVGALDAQRATDLVWEHATGVLNVLYDDHVARFGPINRSTIRSRIDKTGETVVIRKLPAMGGFRDDPLWPLVSALEHYDDADGTARKADLFTRRVVVDRPVRDVTGDPVAGLAACLSEHGIVDVDWISSATSMPPPAVLEALTAGGHIFHDPTVFRWVTAAEYLSGDVRAKLVAARRASQVVS